jgi:hypothetical protein
MKYMKKMIAAIGNGLNEQGLLNNQIEATGNSLCSFLRSLLPLRLI